MEWKIEYYSEKLFNEISSLPKTLSAKYKAIAEIIPSRGHNLGMPHTKYLENGLCEIRLKGMEGIARVFYCTRQGKRIIMLHSFVKKTLEIPRKELELARYRMKEVQNDYYRCYECPKTPLA